MQFPGKGVEFIVNLTAACNLNCDFCSKTSSNPNTLELNELYKIAGWNVKTAILLGGEPTLHPEIGKVIDFFKEMGAEINVQTNGALEPSMYSDVLRADSISFSIDGYKEFHDENRGEGVWNKAVSNLVSLQKAKGVDIPDLPYDLSFHEQFGEMLDNVDEPPDVFIRCTYSKDNVDEVLELSEELDFVDGFAFYPLLGYEDKKLSTGEKYDFYRRVAEKGNIDVMQPSYKQFIDKENWSCPAGRTRLTIGPSGYVYGCYWLPYRVGNLDYTYTRLEESCRDFCEWFHEDESYCIGNCDRWKECNGGCKASKDSFNCPMRGEVSDKEKEVLFDRAEIDKRSIREAGKIIEEVASIC